MRQRLTARNGNGTILAEIEELERFIEADTDESPIEAVAAEDVRQEQETDNWPTTAADRQKFARHLVGMAKKLMA